MNIAIDGPAGAGKSTIAKIAAKKLGNIYVDTGAMYRAMALYMLRMNADPDDESRIENLGQSCLIDIVYREGKQCVMLMGEDVTDLLREEGVGKMASAISRYPGVRRKLVDLQREIARNTGVVMDGRDIGTVVLPDADLKIYLTADPHVRALRRAAELCGSSEPDEAFIREIEEEIIKRDHNDMTRKESPLKMAEDAVLVDSSDMTIEEVADKIISYAKTRSEEQETSC